MADPALYTTWESIIFYTKRFLKVAIPLAIVELPLVATAVMTWKTAGIVAVVTPILTTLDKYARDNGWYSY